jgi:glycosyltransferase involved in cell wall biosynthesis
MSRNVRALVVMHGRLSGDIAGPEIRGWELARSLAAHGLDVMLLAQDAESAERDGVKVRRRTRRRLIREAIRHDVVISPTIAPYLHLIARGRTKLIADLYDPVDLEHAEDLHKPEVALRTKVVEQQVRIQLRFAHLVLCAAPAQETRLKSLGEKFGGMRSDPLVVPFGLAPTPDDEGRRPLRARFPSIGADDPVVLWWGGVWRWFDAITAIRAFEILDARGSTAKLVIAAGKPPRSETSELSDLDQARDLASSLGLIGRVVYFIDDWIPYERRHEYLLEADLGITLHRNAPESAFAARARYVDYLWCLLPPVLNPGDNVADEYGSAGFAEMVPVGDPVAAASAVDVLLASGRHDAARDAGRTVAASRSWEQVTRGLAERLDALAAGQQRKTAVGARSFARLLRACTVYYWRWFAWKRYSVAHRGPA